MKDSAPRLEIDRIESLGDNCELGFVLRSLGIDEGGLFKWARLEIENLIDVLSGNLTKIFEYDNLSPLRLAMVHEKRYGIGWHSSLLCHIVDGKLDFVDDDSTRRIKHKAETKKFNYLCAKFIARLQSGGCIFIFKSNSGTERESVLALDRELARLANGSRYWLATVSVSPAPEKWGQAEKVSDTVIEGWVDRCADYNTADDFSGEAWKQLLANISLLAPYPQWEQARQNSANALALQFRYLSFPEGGAGSTTFTSDYGDVVSLTSTSAWSRRVGDNFRIHSSRDLDSPSCLEWSGVAPCRFVWNPTVSYGGRVAERMSG